MLTKPHLYTTFLFLFLFQSHLYSQNKLLEKREKDCKCPEFDKSKHFEKLLDIGQSPNEIEIRFVIRGMGHDEYSMLSFNQGIYKAVCYVNKLPD